MSGPSQEWVAVDWGTTHFRIWRMQGDLVLGGREANCGLLSQQPQQFEQTLQTYLKGWPEHSPVLMSGMVGSRQGWQEVPYLPLPVSLQDVACHATRIQTQALQRPIFIISGLASKDPACPDVMRGEETQLLGLGAGDRNWSGWVCLPGTHSKWVQVESGTVVRFDSYFTGEMFSLLQQHSLLRHDLSSETVHADHPGFFKGVAQGLSAEIPLLTSMFRIRAHSLLIERNHLHNSAFLSGRLIGEEIRNALGQIQAGQPLHVVGGERLNALYAEALRQSGQKALVHSGENLVRRGLTTAWRYLFP